MVPALPSEDTVLGETFFRKPPKIPAAGKPQSKCPDGKCWELWELWEDKEEEHGASQGSGEASKRKVCLR